MAAPHHQATGRSFTMNNRKETLAYLADCALMDDLYHLEFGLSKRAGLFDELNLPSIGNSIQDFVKSHVSPDHAGGYLGSVADLLAPTVFFRINPIFGVIYLISSQLGFDFTGVVSKILNAVRPKLESGQGVSPEEVSSIGKSIVASEVGSEATAAPDDLLEPLRKYAKSPLDFLNPFNLLGGNKLPTTPWLTGGKGSTLEKIFGNLLSKPGYGRSRSLWLLGGFAIWVVKTVLLGAGLLAGAEAVSKLLGHKSSAPPPTPSISIPATEKVEESTTHPSVVTSPPPAAQIDLPQFASQSELWVVPIIDNLENTLSLWIQDLEPHVSPDVLDKVKKSNKFKTVLTMLKDPRRLGGKSLVMPPQFTSRQQVVDLLLKDFK